MQISKRVLIGFIAAALCVAALTGTALAYFSDKTVASGEHPLTLGYSTEVEENMDGLDKHITITNTGDTEVMVRVQLFYSNANGVDVSVEGSGWTGNGAESAPYVWNYDQVLAPGASTSELVAKVSADAKLLQTNFDVIVVSQSSPAVYDADGNPYGYDWTDASTNE